MFSKLLGGLAEIARASVGNQIEQGANEFVVLRDTHEV